MQRGRIMPPATLSCERNDLTSYAGVVSRYTRGERDIVVTIETDADTTETVSINNFDADSFLLNGNPFEEKDWRKIEEENGRLREGIKVIAWVCLDDATPAVLDWRP